VSRAATAGTDGGLGISSHTGVLQVGLLRGRSGSGLLVASGSSHALGLGGGGRYRLTSHGRASGRE